MFLSTAVFFTLVANGVVLAEPVVTAAAQLAPRQTDPSFVGYISENGGYSDGRTCDYPQTVSTSGGFVQCCPTSGACPFYTSCSDNTLLAASATVPCDVSSALTCNTAIVLPTAGASNGGSYLACWQRTLGSNAFTVVQNTGTGTDPLPELKRRDAGHAIQERQASSSSSNLLTGGNGSNSLGGGPSATGGTTATSGTGISLGGGPSATTSGQSGTSNTVSLGGGPSATTSNQSAESGLSTSLGGGPSATNSGGSSSGTDVSLGGGPSATTSGQTAESGATTSLGGGPSAATTSGSSTSSSSGIAAANVDAVRNGGIAGFMALVAQLLL